MKVLAASALGFAALAAVSAQPQFRSGIILVQLEVSVVDRGGEPLSGLRLPDFTVMESGRPQKIVNVVERGLPAGRLIGDTAREGEPQPVAEPRLVTIILDDAQIPIDARITSRTKAIARTIVESLEPADRGAVVFTRNTKRSAEFTTSRSQLMKAVDDFLASQTGSGDAGFAASGMMMYEIRTSVNTLESVARYLDTVPGRRKSIFLVSPGVSLPAQGGQDYNAALQVMRPLFDQAQRSKVMIYAIDPAGLGSGPGTGIAESGDFASGRTGGLRSRHEFLTLLSLNTGGRSIVDRNNPERIVRQLLAGHSKYYEVVYESSVTETDRAREIKVEVARPESAVRFRSTNTPWVP